MPRLAYLALGTNLGDREGYLREAIARLGAAPGVNFRRASRVYETEPVGPPGQPQYLNMVVELEVAEEVTPRRLLETAKRIESDLGRQHRERWGPREIDIDVLLVGDERVKEDDFEVPHPRLWERPFVVVPLADLAPELVSPEGDTAAARAARWRAGHGVKCYAEAP
jgi:2-amino-4-hydroxy-6-hydroxymethyldihydropteridine diphosphokinase